MLQNRLSWRTYDKLRKTEGLTTCSSRKRLADLIDDATQSKRRRTDLPLMVKKENLLQEALSWPPDKVVNWSQLARDNGLSCSNGGQMIKEYLRNNNIPAANNNQRPLRAARRCKKGSMATLM